jgi:hypothetical protein
MRGRHDPVNPTPDKDRLPGQDELPGQAERDRADVRIVSLLGGIALVVAVGMWFYTKDREMVASDGTTVKQTTGQTTGAAGSRR